MTTEHSMTLKELAELAGIHTSYTDAYHRQAEASPLALASLLEALGFPSGDGEAIAESRERLKKRWETPVPRLVVANAGEERHVAIRTGASVGRWRIEHEDTGDILGSGQVDGDAEHLALPPLPAGYHPLIVEGDGDSFRSTIIAAPDTCWRPDGTIRIWGASAPPYALSSETDLGIGDCTAIKTTALALAEAGASFLALNPMHALFTANRGMISPYSPSSRLFLDPIYIDPTAVAGMEDEARRHIDELISADRLAELRDATLIDYPAVWQLKREVLRRQWQRFKSEGGSRDFAEFREARGHELAFHARFEAVSETPDAAEPDDDLVDFHAWLQWIADTQLRAAQAAAKDAGMPLGLFADLAVGASPDGSELASSPADYIAGASIGAPPDLLAPQGQDWGLRAMSPLALEETGLAAFRRLIAANMRHASGIRIDHAFQLRRLYLIADGLAASDGAYLTYPAEALFASLRIESHRAECAVVGEDLGTPPHGFSQSLAESGVYSYRVLYFERDHEGALKSPADYPQDVLAVVNTHDLATFAGWWEGRDIDIRVEYGIFDASDADDSRRERKADKQQLTELLYADGLVEDIEPPEQAPILEVAKLLARGPSELVSLQLDDIVGAKEQQNIPGVTDGAANWQRRLPMRIEAFAAKGGPLDNFAEAMAAEGRAFDPPKSAAGTS